jgi:hypothetical protein
MGTIEDYVTSIEETCGEERGVIVIFKYDKKSEVIARILKKAKLKNNLSGVIYELTFRDISFRLFSTGKAIFRGASKEALRDILVELLL